MVGKEVHLLLGQYQQLVVEEEQVETLDHQEQVVPVDLVVVRWQKHLAQELIQEEQQQIIQDQISKDILVEEQLNMLEVTQALVVVVVLVKQVEMEVHLARLLQQENREMVVMDFSFQHLLDHLLVCLLLHH
jgi:hypothetical protein